MSLPPLTEKPLTHAQIETRLRVWQERLMLSHWRIKIDWDSTPETDDGTAIAEVNAQDTNYDRCMIRFNRKVTEWRGDAWGDAEMWTADEVIVHELLHVKMVQIDHVIQRLPEDNMHRDVTAMLETAYHMARERYIDSLAACFVAAWEG